MQGIAQPVVGGRGSPWVIFRLLAGAPVQAEGAPSACCPSPEQPLLPGHACLMAPRGTLHLPVTLALRLGHGAVGTVRVLRPVVGLEEALFYSLPLSTSC